MVLSWRRCIKRCFHLHGREWEVVGVGEKRPMDLGTAA